MPEGVTYTKEAEAKEYAEEVGGTVVDVDIDGDGVIDGYNVIEPQFPGEDEPVTRGFRSGGVATPQPGGGVVGSGFMEGSPLTQLVSEHLAKPSPQRVAQTFPSDSSDSSALDRFRREFGREPRGNELAEYKAAMGLANGGVVKDELGYMNGGMSYTERGPIKYSKGGAVKGKTFRGSY